MSRKWEVHRKRSLGSPKHGLHLRDLQIVKLTTQFTWLQTEFELKLWRTDCFHKRCTSLDQVNKCKLKGNMWMWSSVLRHAGLPAFLLDFCSEDLGVLLNICYRISVLRSHYPNCYRHENFKYLSTCKVVRRKCYIIVGKRPVIL